MKRLYFLLTFFCCNIFLLTTALAQAPTNGLVAYYPFNGNANDAVGTNHGTVNGATLTTDKKGVANSAYSFNGTNNYIQVPHSSVFNITGPITLSVWFNTNNVNLSQRIIDKTTVSGSDAYMIDFRPSQQIRFIVANAGSNGQTQAQSNAVFTQVNQWYHFVVTYDNNNVKFYNNGILVNTKTQTGSSVNNSNPLRFGANSQLNGDWFNGKLDDIRIYNRALTDNEVQALYQAEAPPIDLTTGLVAHYKMDGNAQDASGNGNHGTQQGGVNFTTATDRFGVAGKAVGFDGVNDYIEAPNSNTLQNIEKITISAWVRPLSVYGTGNIPILDKTNSSTGGLYSIGLYQNSSNNSNRYVYGGLGNIGFQSTTPIILFGQWLHLVYKVDGTTIKVFVNGNLQVITNTGSRTGLINTLPLRIGTDPGGLTEFLNGSLDDIRIYNRALTDIEVQALYQAEAPPIDITTGLVAHYKMDGNAQDASGNSNHGTQQGGVNFSTATDRFGVAGKAAGFDGVDDFVTIPNSTTLQSPNPQITLSTWFKSNTTNYSILCKGGNSTNSLQYRIQGNNSALSFIFNGSVCDFSGLSITTTNWNNIMIKSDGIN